MIVKDIQEKYTQEKWTIIPIPMPTLRHHIRGYNHAEAIASEISEKTGIEVSQKILVRATTRKRQVMTISRSERIKNQKNVFKTLQDVQGINIILIDDVTTTGATLLEARKILLEKGALNVKAYTIAH
jgi:competence protein ComFC